jgi:hypothetical protein
MKKSRMAIFQYSFCNIFWTIPNLEVAFFFSSLWIVSSRALKLAWELCIRLVIHFMSCYCFESYLSCPSWKGWLLGYLSSWVREGTSLSNPDERVFFVPFTLSESLDVCSFRESTMPYEPYFRL